LAVALCWVLVTIIACSDHATGPEAAQLKLNLDSIALDQRDSVQIIPSVVDAQGVLLSGIPVAFTSRDPSIASVSKIGVVVAVGPAGATTVSVNAAGISRAVPVTVRPVAAKLVVTPNPGTVPQKGTLQLSAAVLDRVDAPIAGATFTYRAAVPTIATVSASGLVTSVGPSGLATFTVQSASFAIVAQIAVTQVPTRLDVAPMPTKIGVGRTRLLSVRLLDAVDDEIKGATFTFTSNAPGVVTVAPDGTLTSIGPLGSATITVRAQGTTLSTDIPVTVVAASHPNGVVTSIALPNGIFGSYAVAIMSDREGYAGTLGGPVMRLDLDAGVAAVIPGSEAGLALAVSPARREVYSALYNSRGIEIISVSGAPTVVDSVLLPAMVLGIVVSPDQRTAYVSTQNGLTAVDLGTRTARALPNVPSLLNLVLDPTNALVLYESGNSGGVYEVDLATGVFKRTLSAAPGTSFYGQGIAVTSDGVLLYAASERGSIEEFNVATGAQTRSFPTCEAWGLALSPDDDQLFVACSGGQAAIIDRATGTTIKTIPSGGARRIAMSPTGLVVLIGASANGVTVIK
jgi:hypothetical protein